ncbi:heterokaryon incompatibility protein-domain-containing protein [Apodospora peruviana]|uniref:Heterokaryon incompatibility protein-domain-containing protein n=1 Tax=Apodospora peruviana TaxID=516989 RepID=A0AAE0HXD7_9PEZI|nr:heterokaryon incompatibility protein-domain-containing protein [Apodospora peruviana]
MWLINVTTKTLENFIGSSVPPYVILSHTWEDQEVSFQDMGAEARSSMKGYQKILKTCELAAGEGIDYAWVDTCCIDKSSSAELSEAINSMFRWYRDAKICHVYLSDMPSSRRAGTSLHDDLKSCRWFTRGWTLQELIAPRAVTFWDQDWNFVGRKAELCADIHSITGVPTALLRHQHGGYLSDYSIAARMSWAAKRQTTRSEDIAYCLLGIFDINMALLYGEGRKAFYRLQEEIIKSSDDGSIFAWTDSSLWAPTCTSVLASRPILFERCGSIRVLDHTLKGMSMTSSGVHAKASLATGPSPSGPQTYILPMGAISGPSSSGIFLRKVGPSTYLRYLPSKLAWVDEPVRRRRVEPIYLISKLPTDRPGLLPNPTPAAWGASTLKVILPNTEMGESTLELGMTYPDSNWDAHDQLFFAANEACRGWAVFGVFGEIKVFDVHITLDLLCACVGWSSMEDEPIRSTIVTRGTTLTHRSSWAIDHAYLQTLSFEEDFAVEGYMSGEMGFHQWATVETVLWDGSKGQANIALRFVEEPGRESCTGRAILVELQITLQD